jgi:hypothetical protein
MLNTRFRQVDQSGDVFKLTTPLAGTLYFSIMEAAPTSGTPDDTDREARTRIADAIVTAAERGRTLTLEDLESEGQPIDALGSDREAQARVVSAWTRRAAELVAKARAAQAAEDRRQAE